MFNKYMYELGSRRSTIRELYEFGKRRAEVLGADSVFDFSIGNPSVPAPKKVRTTLVRLSLEQNSTAVHGYTSAQGLAEVRSKLAESLNQRFHTAIRPDNIYLTCGASSGLAITIKAMNEKSDEFVVLAPYFPEYEVYIKAAGGKVVSVPFVEGFLPDLGALEDAITPHTKAIIINSPNNPSGVVYSAAVLSSIASIVSRKADEFEHPIYVISDEPYRELVYDGVEVPFVMNYFNNCVICYSFSKSLSLPGERIGYVAVNPKADFGGELYSAIMGAGRALGYVCAPAIFQQVIGACCDVLPNLSSYSANRDALYSMLTEIGFECTLPSGAFYLFVKAPNGDSMEFSERAKEYGLLIVPGDDFMAKGYCRIAYCVDRDMIARSAVGFKELFQSYQGKR